MHPKGTLLRAGGIGIRLLILLTVWAACWKIAIASQEPKALPADQVTVRKKVNQFVFVSNISAMVGGFSAVSQSTYISISGLVQVSKEVTSGDLQQLMVAHFDTRPLFNSIMQHLNWIHTEKNPAEGQNPPTTEYYPPAQLLAFQLSGKNQSAYRYFSQLECTAACKAFVEKISDFASKVTLKQAQKGLYARAQKLSFPDFSSIHFDLEIKSAQLIFWPALAHLVQNEMALILMDAPNGKAELSDQFFLAAGQPVHIKIGEEAYLIFPYQYRP